MPAPEFELRVEDHGERLLITPIGELDLATAPQLGAAVGDHVDGQQMIAIDLRELTFMDSSGINELVRIWRHHDHARLVFVAPTGDVARALDLSGVRQVSGSSTSCRKGDPRQLARVFPRRGYDNQTMPLWMIRIPPQMPDAALDNMRLALGAKVARCPEGGLAATVRSDDEATARRLVIAALRPYLEGAAGLDREARFMPRTPARNR